MIKSIVFFAAICSLALACPNEKKCVECTVTGDVKDAVCAICEDSFYDAAVKKCADKVTKAVDKCKTYKKLADDSVVCDICQVGHVLTAANECKPCSTKDCAYCKQDLGTCTACFHRFTIETIEGKTTCVTDDAKKCALNKCEICGDYVDGKPTNCLQCENKFAIDATTKNCVAAASDCYRINKADEKVCDACNWGYYITKNQTCAKNGGGMKWLWILLIVIPLIAVAGYFAYTKLAQKREEDNIYNTV